MRQHTSTCSCSRRSFLKGCGVSLSGFGVASLLKLSEKQVRRLVDRGDLPSHRIGGAIRIDQSDLEDFLLQCRQAPRAPRK